MRLLVWLFVVVSFQPLLFAQDTKPDVQLAEAEKIADINELAKKLASSVAGAIVDGNFREALEVIGPVLTHYDNVASSTLWICPNAMGRPQVVLAISSWRDQRFIEACSFSEHELAFTIIETKWNPTPARKPIALPEAPQPAETEAGRLQQMQELLKRFKGSEAYLGGEVEFEIQVKPIYRYPKSTRLDDGALFAFVRDGDPEALLVLETTKDGWQFMVGLMTGNPMSYSVDGKRTAIAPVRNTQAPYIFVRRQAEPQQN